MSSMKDLTLSGVCSRDIMVVNWNVLGGRHINSFKDLVIMSDQKNDLIFLDK